MTIRVDSLVMGETRRALWAREVAFQSAMYPEVRFRIDSLVDVSHQADTLYGTALGVLYLHGVEKPALATVTVYPDSEAGGTRVRAKLRAPAREFITDFWPDCLGSRACLFGLGVRLNIWKYVFFGADLVLRPDGTGQINAARGREP